MKPFLIFRLPSGHVFELPTEVVAADRAAYYHKDHPDEFPTLQSAMEDSIGLFTDDAYNVRDWLLNNMDVDATMGAHGRLVAFNQPKFAWDEAEYEFGVEPMAIVEPTGDTILGTPVEMVMNAMLAAGELCSFQMLMDQATGKPDMAIAFVRGGEKVVGTFAAGMQDITNFLAEKLAAEQATSPKH